MESSSETKIKSTTQSNTETSIKPKQSINKNIITGIIIAIPILAIISIILYLVLRKKTEPQPSKQCSKENPTGTCPTGKTCVQGECKDEIPAECGVAGKTCPSGKRCVGTKCVDIIQCTTSAQCKAGEEECDTQQHICVPLQCSSTRHCLPGYDCINNKCELGKQCSQANPIGICFDEHGNIDTRLTCAGGQCMPKKFGEYIPSGLSMVYNQYIQSSRNGFKATVTNDGRLEVTQNDIHKYYLPNDIPLPVSNYWRFEILNDGTMRMYNTLTGNINIIAPAPKETSKDGFYLINFGDCRLIMYKGTEPATRVGDAVTILGRQNCP